jgi:hypothetical protein
MKAINGLRKVAVYDPATRDVVLLSLISPESTIAPSLVTTDTATGRVMGGADHAYTIAFFDGDTAVHDQLIQWENADTPVCLVLLFGSGVRFFSDPQPIAGFIDSLATNARDGVSPLNFSIQSIGFSRNIHYGVNVLAAATRQDLGTGLGALPNTLYRPTTQTAGAFPVVTWGGSTGLETGDGVTFKFPFPFPNERIVFGGLTGGGDDITLSSLEEDDTPINSESFTGSGSDTLNTGAACFWLELETDGAASNLYIRVDGVAAEPNE